MPVYKFYYLSAKGLGEPIRLLFHYKNQEFEDCRVGSLEDVANRKDEFPFGKVPVLEIDNNVKIPQSFAIARYLAKQFNLNGKDDVEAAQIDAISGLFLDFHVAIRPFIRSFAGYEHDDLQMLSQTVLIPGIQQFMPLFEKLLSKSGYFASELSYIDFFICELVSSFRQMMPELMGTYKLLNEHVDRIYALPTLQNYLKSRPPTKF